MKATAQHVLKLSSTRCSIPFSFTLSVSIWITEKTRRLSQNHKLLYAYIMDIFEIYFYRSKKKKEKKKSISFFPVIKYPVKRFGEGNVAHGCEKVKWEKILRGAFGK